MSGFFDKIKDAFGTKKPKYKIYEASEVKMVALRTRVILTDIMDQLLKQIGAEDQKFRFVGNNHLETYAVLQSIGEKVIEAESIKIFVEMMRKVENNAVNIAKTNGDIALLKTEIQWYQCVLWYRRSKQVKALEDLYTFCMDFFKGVDITKEMDINCEVFVLYPILKYLRKNEILPLPQILFYLQPYVSCNISKPTLDAIFQLNRNDIANKTQRSSLEDNNSPIKPTASKVNPNSSNIKVNLPSKQSNINAHQQNTSPFNPSYSNMGNIQSSSAFLNVSNQQLPNHNSYTGNTINLNYNQPCQPNQFEIKGNNGFAAQEYTPYSPPAQIDHNPFSRSNKFSNQGNSNTVVPHNSFLKIEPQNPIIAEEKKLPIPHQQIPAGNLPAPTVEPPKKSFFNTLIRTNSKEESKKEPEPTFILADDRQRSHNDFVYNETNQSWVPINRQSYEQFNDNIYQKRKAEEQRKQEAAAQLELQLKLKEEEQKKKQELLAKEREAARLKQQEEARIQAEKEQMLREKEQAERKAREEEERKEREEEQLERERQQRMRERERQEEREINVFVDNERQEIDRGFSGRFSSNMGLRTDFEDYQGEEFAQGGTHEGLNSSIVRFTKEEVPLPAAMASPINLEERDEEESLQAIEKAQEGNSNKPFQLFYYKKLQK